jgi:hypothetical protein
MSRAKSGRSRGRPPRSTTFKLVPIRHTTPNPQKLGRAFLTLAVHRGELQVDLVEGTEGEPQNGTA